MAWIFKLAGVSECQVVHQKVMDCSYRNLQCAWEVIQKVYDSVLVRTRMCEKLFMCSHKKIKAKPWQLDIGEALSLRLDSILIAGTGWGKTVTFILALL